MICPHCNYLFDAKQHGSSSLAHSLLNRPMGIPNGWSVAVMCPRCLRHCIVKHEYGVFPVWEEKS